VFERRGQCGLCRRVEDALGVPDRHRRAGQELAD
jgi:hypothetical protein